MERAKGFEPSTSTLARLRSTRLSYARTRADEGKGIEPVPECKPSLARCRVAPNLTDVLDDSPDGLNKTGAKSVEPGEVSPAHPRRSREGRPTSARGGQLAVAARREAFDPTPTGPPNARLLPAPPRGARGCRRLVPAPPGASCASPWAVGRGPMPSAAMTTARSRPCSAAGSSPTRPSWGRASRAARRPVPRTPAAPKAASPTRRARSAATPLRGCGAQLSGNSGEPSPCIGHVRLTSFWSSFTCFLSQNARGFGREAGQRAGVVPLAGSFPTAPVGRREARASRPACVVPPRQSAASPSLARPPFPPCAGSGDSAPPPVAVGSTRVPRATAGACKCGNPDPDAETARGVVDLQSSAPWQGMFAAGVAAVQTGRVIVMQVLYYG